MSLDRYHARTLSAGRTWYREGARFMNPGTLETPRYASLRKGGKLHSGCSIWSSVASSPEPSMSRWPAGSPGPSTASLAQCPRPSRSAWPCRPCAVARDYARNAGGPCAARKFSAPIAGPGARCPVRYPISVLNGASPRPVAFCPVLAMRRPRTGNPNLRSQRHRLALLPSPNHHRAVPWELPPIPQTHVESCGIIRSDSSSGD
jgi:hypothetical protein